jgi:O-antigen/teichoic acid export membrane protein
LLLDTYFLNQLRRPGLLSILAWINALVSMTLALLLIPALAEKGAALALICTQVAGTIIYFTLYLRISRTRLAQLFIIDTDDLTLIRDQVGTMLGWKGGRG